MNIPNLVHFRTNMLIKDEKPKWHPKKISHIHFREDEPHEKTKKVSQVEFEHGDPDFIDERIIADEEETSTT